MKLQKIIKPQKKALRKTDFSVCIRCEKKPKHKESIYCIDCLYERKMSGY